MSASERSPDRLRFSWYATQECLRSALSSIRAHGLRSSLTMLGIVIGVASVICVIALVQGLSQSISNQLQGLGGSTLTLRSHTPFEDQLRGKRNRLRLQDLEELRFRIDGISNITPLVFAGQGMASQIRYGASTTTGQMYGTTASYQDVQQIFPKSGRFLTDSDDASRRRVVVIGEQMRKDLKLPENPAGEFVQIGNEWFKVVGALEIQRDTTEIHKLQTKYRELLDRDSSRIGELETELNQRTKELIDAHKTIREIRTQILEYKKGLRP